MFVRMGLRSGELLSLEVKDVNLREKILRVRQGKGQKDRLLPIPTVLVSDIREYLYERAWLEKSTSALFVSRFKDLPFTKAGLRILTKKIQKKTKIYFTIQMLRVTFATLMIESGCDIYTLSELMGHEDIQTTVGYLDVSVEHLRGGINRLN